MVGHTMTFCYAPWSNLEILPQGAILPCCKFQDSYYSETFNIQQNSIDQYRQSKMLNQIKQEFQHGQWPQGCERCRIEEENGIESKRQLDYQRWQQHYNNYDFSSSSLLTVSIALGNTCNLKCITCGPHASSKWAKEYKEVHGIEIASFEHVRRDLIKNITSVAPDLVHIDMHGGEPFLSNIDQHQELLDYYIQTDQAKNITIHYTTNGTIFPDDQWITRWDNFAEIDLQLSIDGINSRYEYIRYPADWSVLNSVVDQWLHLQQQKTNFRLSVAHTVSAFNIFYLDEFAQWCQQKGLPKPWMGKLHKPMHLRPTVWPESVRQVFAEKLQSSNIDYIQDWAKLLENTDDSKLFGQFKQFIQQHDQYRKLNFCQTFSEISQYI